MYDTQRALLYDIINIPPKQTSGTSLSFPSLIKKNREKDLEMYEQDFLKSQVYTANANQWTA